MILCKKLNHIMFVFNKIMYILWILALHARIHFHLNRFEKSIYRKSLIKS